MQKNIKEVSVPIPYHEKLVFVKRPKKDAMKQGDIEQLYAQSPIVSAPLDSNQEPPRYKLGALTIELGADYEVVERGIGWLGRKESNIPRSFSILSPAAGLRRRGRGIAQS